MIEASIVIPTKNEKTNIGPCLECVYGQRTHLSFEVVVIDSGSSDGTLDIVKRFPARLVQIASSEFHHARTRNLGASMTSGKYLVFLSGDALPADREWLCALLSNFQETDVAAVYGRQLPKENATPERAFFMDHRYGAVRRVKNANSNGTGNHLLYQFSTVNSAIRREIWEQFPFQEDVNAYEDFSFAIQVVRDGHSIAYEPSAAVFHSHNYSLGYSFRQYFDSGVLYNRRQLWDANQNGQMRSDGVRYVWKELQYLVQKRAGHRVPYVLCYEAARYLGLILGRNEHLLPHVLKKTISSHGLFD